MTIRIRRGDRRGTAAALLLLGLPLLVGVAQPAAGAVGGDGRGVVLQLLEVPEQLQADPRARSYVIDSVRPDTSFRRRILVTNDTGRTQTLDLYVAAAEVGGGSFLPGDRGSQNELTAWMTLEPSQVVLADDASAEVLLIVEVPRAASDGERYATIFAELPAAGGPGVQVVNRVGIRTYLNVAGGAVPAPDFTVDSLTAVREPDGSPSVEAMVRNTGGRALDMGGTLSLTEGPGGLRAGPFPAELGTTLGVGESQKVRVVLDRALPSGPWQARIDLRSGLLERQATATITFPDQAGTSAAPVAAENLPLREDPGVVIPVAAGLLGLALLLLLLLWRRRLKEQEQDEPERDERLLEPAG